MTANKQVGNNNKNKQEAAPAAAPLASPEVARILGVQDKRLLINSSDNEKYVFDCEDCHVSTASEDPPRIYNDKAAARANKKSKEERYKRWQDYEVEKKVFKKESKMLKKLYFSFEQEYQDFKTEAWRNRSLLDRIFGVKPYIPRSYDLYMIDQHEEIYDQYNKYRHEPMAPMYWDDGILPTRYVKCPVCGHRRYTP